MEQEYNNSHILNYLPSRYLHDSWWENIKNGDELKILSSKAEAEPEISKIVLQYFKLEDQPLLEFDTHLQKISLLSPDELIKLTIMLGIVTVCHQVKQAIIKDEVVTYKQQLGTAMYKFAIDVAPEIVKQVPNLPKNSLIQNKSLKAQVFAYGLAMLGLAIKDESRALVTRLILKLGKPSFSYLSDRHLMMVYNKSDCIELIGLLADRFDRKITSFEPEGV